MSTPLSNTVLPYPRYSHTCTTRDHNTNYTESC